MRKEYSINVEGRLIDFSTPVVMGILNITPDSFYDGGRLKSDRDILKKAENMLSDGATILDVGGYSSRPGAENVTVEEEKKRVCESISLISKQLDNPCISIDTFRSEVAEAALNNGANIINDITAGEIDPIIIAVAARHQCPYVAMHMRGTPQTMKTLVQYDNVIHDLLDYFANKISQLRESGVVDIIIDPGFGFAKTLEQNYELLGGLKLFEVLEVPILVGVSRKSMIYKALGISAEDALNGTSILNTFSLLNGANILRVHDVKQAVEAIKLTELIAH